MTSEYIPVNENLLDQIQIASLIVTPIISAIAIYFYYQALKTSKEQNNLNGSAALTQLYFYEINQIIERAKQRVLIIQNHDRSEERWNFFELSRGLYPSYKYEFDHDETKFQDHIIEFWNKPLRGYDLSLQKYKLTVYAFNLIFNDTSEINRLLEDIENLLISINLRSNIFEPEHLRILKEKIKNNVLKEYFKSYRDFKNIDLPEDDIFMSGVFIFVKNEKDEYFPKNILESPFFEKYSAFQRLLNT